MLGNSIKAKPTKNTATEFKKDINNMAEGGPSRNVSENDEDIECIQRSELSQGREVVQRTFLTDKKTGQPTIVVHNANLVTSGDITIHNHVSSRTKKSKALKPLTTSTDEPSTQDLTYISGKLGTRWRQLGRNLGLDDPTLDQLDLDNPHNSDERNYQMLRKWMNKEGTQANKSLLAKLLAKTQMGKLADYLAC
ncbi:hypothetical protein RRG08_006803 [Elysia crispata]|uniref:Death domain-containing protein n=1 Tax=Elysia crispata TaxID=231223 RepID=A0AAE1AYH5_9GAST|nr:hypothetical protein RRG08_006803 [Elysia crispata]